jgi:hypothetical protein
MGLGNAARLRNFGEFTANLRARALAGAANGRAAATLSYGPIARFHFSVYGVAKGFI